MPNLPFVPIKAGSLTILRWKGMTVGMPSICNSSRALLDLSRASVRVAPVTISFAIIESKEPLISAPASTPVSTRTPGPPGTLKVCTVPGAGMKFLPASSPLILNSNE